MSHAENRSEVIERLVAEFMVFWATHFPEQARSRLEALQEINELQDGSRSRVPDAAMVPYQDRVASVYGAYEDAVYQRATMCHILTHLVWNGPATHLVSIGCGPASYELWLLERNLVKRVTLVDQSPAMLARARVIAEAMGVTDRVTFVCADARHNGLPPMTADLVFCINSMHWSAYWVAWIQELDRVLRRKGQIFMSMTMGLPRSNIDVHGLVQVFTRHFVHTHADMVVQPIEVGDGNMAVSMRHYVVGRKR